jgi:hypothetical protein
MRSRTEGDFRLLLFLVVNRVPAQTRAVLLELQFFAPRLAAENVVVVTRLFADEKDGFSFLFAFGHNGSLLVTGKTLNGVSFQKIAPEGGEVVSA